MRKDQCRIIGNAQNAIMKRNLERNKMSMLTMQIMSRKKPSEFELIRHPLKSCPFCQNHGVWFDDELTDDKHDFIRCVCSACGACAPYRDCRMNALAVWNQRERIRI